MQAKGKRARRQLGKSGIRLFAKKQKVSSLIAHRETLGQVVLSTNLRLRKWMPQQEGL